MQDGTAPWWPGLSLLASGAALSSIGFGPVLMGGPFDALGSPGALTFSGILLLVVGSVHLLLRRGLKPSEDEGSDWPIFLPPPL